MEFAAAIEALILRIPQLSPGCVIRELQREAACRFRLSVEIRPAWSTACAEERAGYAQALQQLIERELALHVLVSVERAGALRCPD